MRGRGGGGRKLLCKYVLAYQSKSMQAIIQCHELCIFQMRLQMMFALIYVWEQNKKRAKQLIDWSSLIFSQFQQHPP